MTDKKYNGWTNWETWNTNLWMTNEEGWYHEARAIVARHVTEADEEQGTPREVDAYSAGRALADWWDETAGPVDRGSPLSDAWTATLYAVNWIEIAEGLGEE
jgi:hypothetical protein